MKHACLFAFVLATLPPSLHAQPVDPLWSKTLAHAALAKNWAPADKEVSTETVKDGKHETTITRSHLTGWLSGSPVYETAQLEPKREPGKPPARPERDMPDAKSMIDALMRPNAAVRRTDAQVLHGKAWTQFDVVESDGPVDVSIRLWVDPLTGVARQTESKVHGTLLFDAVTTTTYAPHPVAGSLPDRTELQMKLLLPFKKATVHVVSSMANWTPRPN